VQVCVKGREVFLEGASRAKACRDATYEENLHAAEATRSDGGRSVEEKESGAAEGQGKEKEKTTETEVGEEIGTALLEEM